MSTRMIRNTGALLALVLGLLAFVASPAAAQDSTPAADQPVVVGETEVTWTGDWQYDSASSMEQQATLNQVDPASGMLRLATYGEFADESVESPEDALETFSEAFFQGAGAEGVVEAGSGELDNGAVWKIYTFDLQGLQLSLLITVSETSGGEYVVSTLTGNTEGFAETITQAQGEIMLNGEPTFLEGVDAQQVTSNLSASPVASPEATPAS